MKVWLRAIAFLLLGLALGVGLGLYLGWVAWPTEFTDAHPGALQTQYRRDYALMVATNYALTADLESARQAVSTLGDKGSGADYFFSLTLDTILRGDSEEDIRYMVTLAADLGLYSPAMDPFLDAPPPPTGEGE